MRRQSALVVAVVALTLLAGCSALPFGGGSAVENVEYPDGTSQDGIDNPQTVVQNHQQLIAGEDYTITQVQNQQIGDREQSVRVDVRVDSTDEQFAATIQQGEVNASTYFENGTIYTMETANESTQYRVNESQRSFGQYQSQFSGGQTIGQILGSVNLEATEVRDDGDTSRIVYNITGLSEQAQQQQQNGDIDVSGQFVIDTDGRIHEFRFTQETQMQSTTVNIQISDVGQTSVDRPDWVDTAEQQSANESTDSESTQTPAQNETDS